ncbi:hypothetical protein [Kitasatospora sp. MAP5-34]|uniref:ABC transporter substrate-binding protein n=1 Tax=Kitasatospora sp. MAP5-34 TaxID=3035102 RepID=UPI0024767D6C|nr:hypothetical protein [Kitasatospora sp. MAP5-34]MDH6579363.1 hypothetical protein [Kitasatospora sp. MAP5-34]
MNILARVRSWLPWGAWGRLTKGLVLGLVLLLLALGGWSGWSALRPDLSCGPGVEKRGPAHECIGVTDGGFSFLPRLAPVSARIKAENDRIAGRPHATVALMVPLTETDDAEQQKILREVQGAYLAQYQANRDNSKAPAIRLVLANPGAGGAQWRPVTDQLEKMAKSPRDNLRAVAGFDTSVTSTQQTILHLTKDLHIPVVGGAITADDLADSKQHPDTYPGLARIAPTNTEEAAALFSYNKLNKGVTPDQTLVVEDLRQDDNYIKSLRTAFEGYSSHPPEQFRSPDDIHSTGNLSNDFQRLVPNICASSARTIYFAGRYTQLRQFVDELGHRGCSTTKYTVITADAADTLASDPDFDWSALNRGSGITLQYAAVANQHMWDGDPKGGPGSPGSSPDAVKQLEALTGKDAPSDVGQIGAVDFKGSRTMVAHDSVWTAITAVHNSASQTDPMPSLREVSNMWLRLRSASKVEGTSGWICLDNYGNPYDKAVAVVELDPQDKSIKFDGLAWPEGSPPNQECTPDK